MVKSLLQFPTLNPLIQNTMGNIGLDTTCLGIYGTFHEKVFTKQQNKTILKSIKRRNLTQTRYLFLFCQKNTSQVFFHFYKAQSLALYLFLGVFLPKKARLFYLFSKSPNFFHIKYWIIQKGSQLIIILCLRSFLYNTN